MIDRRTYFLDLCKQMHMYIILHKPNKVVVNYYPLLVKKFMSSINNLFNIYHDTVIVLSSVELWLTISYEINICQRHCNDIVKLCWMTFVFSWIKTKGDISSLLLIRLFFALLHSLPVFLTYKNSKEYLLKSILKI